ncbi:hypothetical protein ES707_14964 [subsurface metagenome]
MAFETPITIKEAISEIFSNRWLLPAIQREFVWESEQIEWLFDSLMQDYPIGSFLFWNVKRERSGDYQFYELMKEYHERDKIYYPKANVSGNEDITAILDGQQRLSALYIGLKGTYAYKLLRMRWNHDSAFPDRRLYLNLFSKSKNPEREYDFQFLTQDEARQRGEHTYWFTVGDILDITDEYEVNKYLIENKLMILDKEEAHFANKTLFKLHSVIHRNLTINYFLEKDQDIEKVLNIFIRVNIGGTKLKYSDMLLSIAIAQWKEKDAKDEIRRFVEMINKIGEGFDFDKDYVLKSCLVLMDTKDIAFKVRNFTKDNMRRIEENWDRIMSAIRLATILVSSFGYNRETLTSDYALIPISYYLLKKGCPSNFVESAHYSDDRKQIQKWLTASLLKRIFSGQPDNVLRPVRQVLSDGHSSFPLREIIDKLKSGTKSMVFTDDDVENLLFYQYGQSYTFSTLALLYPSLDFRNRFHIDHIFPRSYRNIRKLSELGVEDGKISYYLENCDKLANLQMLEGTINQEKSDASFEEWLYKIYPNVQERREYMSKHYIPDVDLGFDNFEQFILEREKLIRIRFRETCIY